MLVIWLYFSRITSGSYSDFSIDSSTGIIKTMAALDREMRDSYALSILVVDSGQPQVRYSQYSLSFTN